VRRDLSSIGRMRWFLALLAVTICPSCGTAQPEAPPSLLPDPQLARQALQDALEEWRTSPLADTTSPSRKSMIFVDQQRRPGQKLREFAVLGDSVVDNCRRYVVRLSLAEPDESLLAAYYVFDRQPIWVYRVEDFDMMMHMDMAPEDSPRSGHVLGSEEPPRAVSGERERERGEISTAKKAS
jgi:hypothetical protein